MVFLKDDAPPIDVAVDSTLFSCHVYVIAGERLRLAIRCSCTVPAVLLDWPLVKWPKRTVIDQLIKLRCPI